FLTGGQATRYAVSGALLPSFIGATRSNFSNLAVSSIKFCKDLSAVNLRTALEIFADRILPVG
ncbi:MAG: hypothetical protein ACRD51_13845, partial [Candidatus Acidiferrum sp.]